MASTLRSQMEAFLYDHMSIKPVTARRTGTAVHDDYDSDDNGNDNLNDLRIIVGDKCFRLPGGKYILSSRCPKLLNSSQPSALQSLDLTTLLAAADTAVSADLFTVAVVFIYTGACTNQRLLDICLTRANVHNERDFLRFVGHVRDLLADKCGMHDAALALDTKKTTKIVKSLSLDAVQSAHERAQLMSRTLGQLLSANTKLPKFHRRGQSLLK